MKFQLSSWEYKVKAHKEINDFYLYLSIHFFLAFITTSPIHLFLSV